jgi:peptide-methionine (S)-S-oxide reductase
MEQSGNGAESQRTEKATFEQVCSDTTGHVEVCQVTYDPEQISYEQLLDVFWGVHDPTQVNRQGPDVGTQYRSVIFVHTPEQELAATKSKAELQARLGAPVATQIEPAQPFWRAEEYHQCYLERRSTPSGMLRSLIGH